MFQLSSVTTTLPPPSSGLLSERTRGKHRGSRPWRHGKRVQLGCELRLPQLFGGQHRRGRHPILHREARGVAVLRIVRCSSRSPPPRRKGQANCCSPAVRLLWGTRDASGRDSSTLC